jgi:hypothetical protein
MFGSLRAVRPVISKSTAGLGLDRYRADGGRGLQGRGPDRRAATTEEVEPRRKAGNFVCQATGVSMTRVKDLTPRNTHARGRD